MRKVAASLAAVLAGLALGACGGDGAEPGAPQRATLVLDFAPNAVHTGIYAALRRGYFEDEGVELEVREPSASTDAPKLLEAGRADFAILDIHDLGIAREQGLDVVQVAAIVQRPLASVIARADRPIRRPRDLEGHTVGVTGLPSDDAVLDSEVEADGGHPSRVNRVTIGFNAVASLAAGKVDAATGFWNAEAVALRRRGIAVRVFKVDRYGAPPYPELVLCTLGRTLLREDDLVTPVVGAMTRGYRVTRDDPRGALDDLLAENPELDRDEQAAQLRALRPALPPPAALDVEVLRDWARWDLRHGILTRPLKLPTSMRAVRAGP
jgi:putative hydroxymethylpyrimidine transport system substrate-binding protein